MFSGFHLHLNSDYGVKMYHFVYLLLFQFLCSLSPEELQRLNNLRDDNIFEGDVLAVSAAGNQQRSCL